MHLSESTDTAAMGVIQYAVGDCLNKALSCRYVVVNIISVHVGTCISVNDS